MLLCGCFSLTVFAQRNSFQDNRNSRQFHRPNNFRDNGDNSAQREIGGKKLQAIQNIKEGFLGKQLNLTDDEAERFWPVYRQYQNETMNIRRLKRLNNSNAQANGPEQIRKDLEYESQLVDIKKRYNDAFLKILSPQKVSLLYKGEREFADELVRRAGIESPGGKN